MIIEYEKAVAGYMQNLTTQLRRFAPSEDFLDLWVHDESHTSSILNMLEAAHSYGLKSVSLEISSAEAVKGLDLARLTKASGCFCRIAVEKKDGEKLLLNVDFDQKIDSLASLGIVDVPTLYRLQFNYKKEMNNYRTPLSKRPHLVPVEASVSGVLLQANIDKSHIVCELSYEGPGTVVSERLLDELCSLMLGKPVIECRDHSVICLEYILRDKSEKRIPAGIVTPFNTWVVFKDLAHLTRGLLEDYRKKSGYQGEDNFYSPPISPRWLSLSDPERVKVLNHAIEDFCKSRSTNPDWFAIKEIRHQFKIIMDMHPEICHHTSTILLELEVYLRKQVEQTLCIHKEEEPDQNKMRWDRPAVKSQLVVPKKVVNLRSSGGEQ